MDDPILDQVQVVDSKPILHATALLKSPLVSYDEYADSLLSVFKYWCQSNLTEVNEEKHEAGYIEFIQPIEIDRINRKSHEFPDISRTFPYDIYASARRDLEDLNYEVSIVVDRRDSILVTLVIIWSPSMKLEYQSACNGWPSVVHQIKTKIKLDGSPLIIQELRRTKHGMLYKFDGLEMYYILSHHSRLFGHCLCASYDEPKQEVAFRLVPEK
ncbi:MAG: hypothetical protein Sylvanvirus1_83 [Sylvanvirus sp.]|uniref:Uncharacterized protein n=1 Tax=Sylvanvirus sp. TaxID=2487774 RepID=A0A3G5AH19_9VIRU|nr:MAG: hypothetical protein Sylvanvirus1_83 [Sylvanvirus sp.]